jgi:hypothetical protein
MLAPPCVVSCQTITEPSLTVAGGYVQPRTPTHKLKIKICIDIKYRDLILKIFIKFKKLANFLKKSSLYVSKKWKNAPKMLQNGKSSLFLSLSIPNIFGGFGDKKKHRLSKSAFR